jgi:hypothetical protein
MFITNGRQWNRSCNVRPKRCCSDQVSKNVGDYLMHVGGQFYGIPSLNSTPRSAINNILIQYGMALTTLRDADHATLKN